MTAAARRVAAPGGAEGAGVFWPSAASISAMGAPMGTVSPSSAKTRNSDPSTGDGTSIVTLSVTTSTKGS